jgi:hypothetical protein
MLADAHRQSGRGGPGLRVAGSVAARVRAAHARHRAAHGGLGLGLDEIDSDASQGTECPPPEPGAEAPAYGWQGLFRARIKGAQCPPSKPGTEASAYGWRGLFRR